MIKYFLPVLGIIFLAACSGSEKGKSAAGEAVISGVVTNPTGDYVLIQKLGKEGLETVDSVILNEDGSFRSVLENNEPGFYRVNLFNRKVLNVIIDEPTAEVFIEADASGPAGKHTIRGTEGIMWMNKIDSLAKKQRDDVNLLNQEAMNARNRGENDVINDIREQYFFLINKHSNNLKELIWQSKPSLAGLYGINYVDLESQIGFADSIATYYNNELPDHYFTQDLVTKVNAIKRLAIGSDAPEISLPTPEGENLSLSSLEGKYVLIDFWAAWCKPCRAENPNVVRLYNKYKDENFEILGVSLDRKREDWLKAIENDRLTWKHVSDLAYFNSEAARDYNIQAIPATYLIGPDGKIVAKGLRGESLRQKLEELFGA